MQIFVISDDYKECALYLDDRRLNKQIIECCQILSTALWIENCDLAETLYSEDKIYLPTHENHPICRNTKYFYNNLLKYTFECIVEWKYRFNKIHGCNKYLTNLKTYDIFNKYTAQPFINATTNHKHIDNLHEAYKQELQLKWKNSKPKWTKRGTKNG